MLRSGLPTARGRRLGFGIESLLGFFEYCAAAPDVVGARCSWWRQVTPGAPVLDLQRMPFAVARPPRHRARRSGAGAM